MKNHIVLNDVETIVGEVKVIELSSKNVSLKLTNYGAGIVDIFYKGENIIQRPQSFDDYLTSNAYYGKTMGRTSGRLFPPSYKIDDTSYDVKPSKNEDVHLHGGDDGFSFKMFEFIEYMHDQDGTSVKFRYVSKDQISGYPGELTLDVVYTLTKKEEIKIQFHATSSKDTLCNITNHLYFNLNQDKNNMDYMHVRMPSDYIVCYDVNKKPQHTEEVIDTPYDINQMRSIKNILTRLDQNGIEGLDTTYLLDSHKEVEIYDDESNLGVLIKTDYPSIVLYTHNYPEKKQLLNCNTDGIHGSLAVECQYEPAGIHTDFLNKAILRTGKIYHHEILIKPYKK